MAPVRFAAALALLAALWLAMLLLGAGMTDSTLLGLLYANHPSLAHPARLLTELGGSPALLPAAFAAALTAWFMRRDWRAPGWYLAMTLAGRLLVELQKGWTMRLRPDAHELLAPIASYAFPSGHAANATIVWLGAALLLAQGKARPWAVAGASAVALIVGLTRPVLGVHWPSDVVAGWSFGLFWTLLWVRLSGPDGTAGQAGAFLRQRREVMDKTRPDDSALIDEAERGPSQSGVSGGNLQREVAARAEEEHEVGSGGDEGDSVTRVHGSDKPKGGDRPNLPNRD